MPDERRRVNAANEPDEQSPRSPENYRHDPTRSRIGSDGIPVRSRTILIAGLALAMVACTSGDTPTEPPGSPSLARAGNARYTAVDLGTLAGCCYGDEDNAAVGINPAGQVVGSTGTSEAGVHAFVWDKGVMTDLGTLDGSFSIATGINPKGQVVGYAGATYPAQHAFLWEKGVMTDLGTLGGSFSSATAINAAGQVVGWSHTNTGETHAFLWEKGVMSDLGAGLGSQLSMAYGINAAGDVVGVSQLGPGMDKHPTLWTRK